MHEHRPTAAFRRRDRVAHRHLQLFFFGRFHRALHHIGLRLRLVGRRRARRLVPWSRDELTFNLRGGWLDARGIEGKDLASPADFGRQRMGRRRLG